MTDTNTNNDTQKIKAICLDQKIVEIPIETAKKIPTINDMISSYLDMGSEIPEEPFPLQASSLILKAILEYVSYHLRNPKIYEEEDKANSKDPIFMVEWDKTFLQAFVDKKNHHKNLLKLYEASHYLDRMDLRKLVAKQIAKMIHEAADPDAIREEFGFAEIEIETESQQQVAEAISSNTRINNVD